MTNPSFTNHADAKKAGFFSRRHRDGRAHQEAREYWIRTKSPEAKRAAAIVMTAERGKRDDREQLALIEKRRGTSAREAERINARLANPFKGAK